MSDQPVSRAEKTISLMEIWQFLAPIKWPLFVGGIFGAILGFGGSWLIHPVYRATTTMLPTKSPEASNGLGGIASQVGGLAALAGINLQPNDNSVGSQEYLRSDTLKRKFIETHDLMAVLLPNRWDPVRRQGIPGILGKAPTESDGVRRLKSVLKISEDKRTGLVTLIVDWRDPSLASQWANDFVKIANDSLRTRAMSDAQATIDYLNEKIDKSPSVQVKESLSRIIESELKTLALAKVREDYAFRVVDVAVLPDDVDIVKPQRFVMAVVGFLFGAALFGLSKARRVSRRARG
jgi:uncharacterized protein involved in exopolysaccharide biosynthesis